MVFDKRTRVALSSNLCLKIRISKNENNLFFATFEINVSNYSRRPG
jgi:hypothetical protein